MLERQVKAFSAIVQELHEIAEFATKRDRADLRHEMKELETGLRME